MKYQHGALSTELNKISVFTQEKLEQYQHKCQPEALLLKRNIYDTLKNSMRIVSEELNIKDEEQPKLHFEVFGQIEKFMYKKLCKVFAKEGVGKSKSKSNNQKYSSKKAREKSSISPLRKPVNVNTSAIQWQSGSFNSKEKEKDKKTKSTLKASPTRNTKHNNYKTEIKHSPQTEKHRASKSKLATYTSKSPNLEITIN
jgi:hypothetical protein